MRMITRVVQIAPFVYLLFYAMYLLSEPFLGGNTPWFVDTIMYVNPFTILLFLLLGRLLRLCAWFKTACVMPMVSWAEGYVDSFIFQFTQTEIIAIDTTIGLIALLFFIGAYKHFAYGRR